MTRRWRVPSLALWLLAAGCSEQPCALHRCDVTSPSCQRSVLEATICAHGGGQRATAALIDLPVVIVELQDYLDEVQAKAMADTERADSEALLTRGLSLLRMSTGAKDLGEIARQKGQDLAGFYSSDHGRVTLIDRGRGHRDLSMHAVLVHEYAHALQDAEFGLASLRGETIDSQLAASAVVEGQAVLVTDRVLTHTLGFAWKDVDWEGGVSSLRKLADRRSRETDEPYHMLHSNFTYAYGASFLRQAWKDDGWAAVDDWLSTPPVSSAQVMVGPRGAIEVDPWLDPEIAKAPAPDLGVDFGPPVIRSLGGYGLWAFLARFADDLGGDPDLSGLLAVQVRGDQLAVSEHADGSAVTVWWLRFADEQTARELARMAPDAFDGEVQAWQDASDVWLVAAEDPSHAPADVDTLRALWSDAP